MVPTSKGSPSSRQCLSQAWCRPPNISPTAAVTRRTMQKTQMSPRAALTDRMIQKSQTCSRAATITSGTPRAKPAHSAEQLDLAQLLLNADPEAMPRYFMPQRYMGGVASIFPTPSRIHFASWRGEEGGSGLEKSHDVEVEVEIPLHGMAWANLGGRLSCVKVTNISAPQAIHTTPLPPSPTNRSWKGV